MKNAITITATAILQEAYVKAHEILIVQGDTILTGILEHVRQLGRINANQLNKDLFPSLPVQVCDNLLSGLVAKGLLSSTENDYAIAENPSADAQITTKLAAHQMLKVCYLNFANHKLFLHALVVDARADVKNEKNFLSESHNHKETVKCKHRPGFSYVFGDHDCKLHSKIADGQRVVGKQVEVALILTETGGHVVHNGATIWDFGPEGSISQVLRQSMQDLSTGKYVEEVKSYQLEEHDGKKQLRNLTIDGRLFEVKSHPEWELIPNSVDNAAEICWGLRNTPRWEEPTLEETKAVFEKYGTNWGIEWDDLVPLLESRLESY